MTVRGENYADARRWQVLRELPSRTSLRTKLIVGLLALVILALAAMGVVGVSLLRGYLIRPTDSLLTSVNVQQATLSALGGDPRAQSQLAANDFSVWWLPEGGTPQAVVEPSPVLFGAGQGQAMLAQSLTGLQPWLKANPDTPATVAGQIAGDRWRVTGIAASVNGTSGTVVLGTDVSSVYTTVGQLAGADLIVSVVIASVMVIIAFAVVRASLRPLVEIEETAGVIAGGHLDRRVPERNPRTEIGRLGRSLNAMLGQIEAAFRAREESEAAAHLSKERMRRFIADASHELRTPLTAIRGFAEYYRQRGGLARRWDRDQPAGDASPAVGSVADGLGPGDVDRIMGRVENETARMGLLVEDLLVLARMDQQRPLARQPVDMLVLAVDAVHDARLQAPDRTIGLLVQPGAAFLVIGDEARLRQVIGNLMSNALTHTPDGTPVEVSVSSSTLTAQAGQAIPAVIVDVTDHGPGLSVEQAQRVFERFYRADQARTRSTGGSGLGLSIVRALIEAQDGSASVHTAPGEGATFRITLPLDPDAVGDADGDLDDEADS
jgi:two-component system OmpR family sensor kinase